MNRIITKVNYVKYFTYETVHAYFFNFNRSTIYAFLVLLVLPTRLSKALLICPNIPKD